jgi:hypothetical protein
VRLAVDMPLTNSSSLLHTYFSIGWNPDCENWYKIWFKFTCRVRALGAFIRNTYLACQQRPETKNLGDDMSATSCKTGTSWVFPWTPLGRSTAGWLTVGRDVTVGLSTKSLRKFVHIQKDASWAGNSPGISLETNGHLLFLLIDNWCDKIIIVPGPGTKAFSRESACPTIYKSPGFCWIIFLSPHI